MTSTKPIRSKSSRRLSHARDFTSKGFLAKLLIMALINAFGLYGIMAAWGQKSWGIFFFLAITLIIADYVYFTRRGAIIPLKYLLPGLIFLIVYQLYIMANTAYVAFTNYGDGHMSDKSQAITQILRSSDTKVPGTNEYPVTIVTQGNRLGLAIVFDNTIKVGSAESPLANTSGERDGNKVTNVTGWRTLSLAEIQTDQTKVLALRVNLSADPTEGWLRTDNGVSAYIAKPALHYDAKADTFTSPDGKVYSANSKVGVYEDRQGEQLAPGWQVVTGFSNFTKMFTDSRLTGPFLSVLVWTFAFAFLSVITTFALGLFLAVIFNDHRVKLRRTYRSLFILPYAFPGFLAALIWRGMMNKDFGIINHWTGITVDWLGNGFLAKLSILSANLWLGFPYMFLIATGALQSIPGELTEAAIMDGANAWKRFWSVTFPLVLVSTAPLLIASFAFNFNNFSLIYMMTAGGPAYPGAPIPVGETDILISLVYSVAFNSGLKQYGLASAMSIIIFVLVGIISWLGFRQTRKLEELV